MNRDKDKRVVFKHRVIQWGQKTEISVHSITVRSMKAKWASCSSSGRLTFDASLLDLPDDLQDYVIVHELLHFQVPNHGPLWKSLMRAHLGDFESLDRRLKKRLKGFAGTRRRE